MENSPPNETGNDLGLTPTEIVDRLDRYIIGQRDAKRMVAIALRNRARRRMVADPELQNEIYPKNIIMIGPTGVGKTEIARRLARLVQAPFIKVEATKFTEVGYVGRDVDSMIRDLVETAVNMVREEWTEHVQPLAENRTEERILDLLLPPPPGLIREVEATAQGGELLRFSFETSHAPDDEKQRQEAAALHKRYLRNREKFRQMLNDDKLDDRQIDVNITQPSAMVSAIPLGPNMPGMEEMGMNLQDMLQNMMPTKTKEVKMPVGEARRVLLDEEIERLLDMDKIVRDALERVEESGIVFIDEIDKIAGRSDSSHGPDVSREGVQRDILPIIEGSTVFTKYGMVHTDHILFIAAGAFHMTKPSDLIPELQGRFPLRVELTSLQIDDLKRILTEPENALTRQYVALLETEGIELAFDDSAIQALAENAFRVNEQTENIGARRLHTLMEKVLEELSFDAPQKTGDRVVVDAAYVEEKIKDIIEDQDLSRFIL